MEEQHKNPDDKSRIREALSPDGEYTPKPAFDSQLENGPDLDPGQELSPDAKAALAETAELLARNAKSMGAEAVDSYIGKMEAQGRVTAETAAKNRQVIEDDTPLSTRPQLNVVDHPLGPAAPMQSVKYPNNSQR